MVSDGGPGRWPSPPRGPGANGGRHRPGPDEQAPGLPAGVSNARAAAMAEEANAWYGALSHLRPGPVAFRVVNKAVQARGSDGAPVDEVAVQVWAMTSNGTAVYHLPPDLADELAVMLSTAATQARTGLDTRHSKIITPSG